jgi:cephalosporin hydroxylase
MSESMYQWAANTDSDIREHIPTLRALASACRHVTEFGTRTGVSTKGLLAGRPEVLITYDLVSDPEIKKIAACAGRTRFRFIQADVLEVEIEPTDMLFIDTRHTAAQVYAELSRHASKVRRYLVLHDTETCGDVDPYFPDEPGIGHGIARYMAEHPGEWRLKVHYPNCNGLTVYERCTTI